MTKKQEFIEYVKQMQEVCSTVEMNDNAKIYWDALCFEKDEKEKPMFTDNGKLILKCMQDHPETITWKSKDIAEELFISAKTVSGSLRKLITDGFVEKIGESPFSYMITENGKNITID